MSDIDKELDKLYEHVDSLGCMDEFKKALSSKKGVTTYMSPEYTINIYDVLTSALSWSLTEKGADYWYDKHNWLQRLGYNKGIRCPITKVLERFEENLTTITYRSLPM